jgi:tetratricopeptide (TPR) repeat protein
VRRGIWWAIAAALVVALGIRLWATPAARQWRYERQPIEALRTAAERRPGDPVLRLTLGRKLLAAGQVNEAIEEFRKAAALEPQSTEALAGLGQALAAAGQDDEAFAALELSLSRRPTAGALIAQGQLYLSHQVPEKSVLVLERATQLEPENAEAWRRLAAARAATGQWAAAETAWHRFAALRPEDSAALTGRAEALIQLGRPVEAEPLLREALKRQPDSALAHTLLGAALAAFQPPSLGPAEAAYREALRLDPASPDAAYGLSLLLLREGRAREAVPLLEALQRRAPDVLRARFQYARALRAVGRHREADQALRDYHRRAEAARREMELRGRLTLRPNDPELKARLSRLLRAKDPKDREE